MEEYGLNRDLLYNCILKVGYDIPKSVLDNKYSDREVVLILLHNLRYKAVLDIQELYFQLC